MAKSKYAKMKKGVLIELLSSRDLPTEGHTKTEMVSLLIQDDNHRHEEKQQPTLEPARAELDVADADIEYQQSKLAALRRRHEVGKHLRGRIRAQIERSEDRIKEEHLCLETLEKLQHESARLQELIEAKESSVREQARLGLMALATGIAEEIISESGKKTREFDEIDSGSGTGSQVDSGSETGSELDSGSETGSEDGIGDGNQLDGGGANDIEPGQEERGIGFRTTPFRVTWRGFLAIAINQWRIVLTVSVVVLSVGFGIGFSIGRIVGRWLG